MTCRWVYEKRYKPFFINSPTGQTLDGFSRLMADTTRTRARICLLGVSLILLLILEVKYPKTPILGAWIGVFKRNCLWLLIAVAKWNEMKVCCGEDIRIRTRSFVEDGGTELQWYYVAGSTSVYIYIIVVAAVIIVVLVVVILLLLKRRRSGSGILQYFDISV